jgi:uncharacterized glyoxalase superfamily protein PhnB
MNPPPAGWPRASSALFYDDAPAAIDFLERAFGFETRLRIEGPDGAIEHSELLYGEAVVMVGSTQGRAWEVSPAQVGGRNTQALFFYVDDVDAHCARARAAGATITKEPVDTDYGEEWWVDRSYQCVDPEGHRWWFAHRVRTPSA